MRLIDTGEELRQHIEANLRGLAKTALEKSQESRKRHEGEKRSQAEGDLEARGRGRAQDRQGHQRRMRGAAQTGGLLVPIKA